MQARYVEYAERMVAQFEDDYKHGRVPEKTKDFNNRGDRWHGKVIEAAFFDRFGIPFPEKENYLPYDCSYYNFKLDTKNQRATGVPLPHYDSNYKASQSDNKCDLFIFSRTQAPKDTKKRIDAIFLCGWAMIERIHLRGHLENKGTVITRSDRSSFPLESDTWMLPFSQLFPMGILTEFCKNYHREDLKWYEAECWKEDQLLSKTGELL